MIKNLNEITNKNPFKVPENYFDGVNQKIISSTVEKKEAGRRVIFHGMRPLFAVAASVAGLFLIGFLAVKILTGRGDSFQVSEVLNESNTELFLNDIDVFTLEENAGEIGFSETGPGVSNDKIIEYLISENIDINEIYEQL
jgi:hypothetical protein